MEDKPNQNDDNMTGIAADDMYRMSSNFICTLCGLRMSANGLRLFHAILHQTCRHLPSWSEDQRQPEEGYRSSSKSLKRQLGLLRTKSNRDIKEGLVELQRSDAFQWLEFAHGSEWVTWRFTDDALALVLENSTYGLFDASGLVALKRPIDFHIFELTSLHRRMRKPKFELTVPEIQHWVSRDNADWSDMRLPFLTALQKSCCIYNLTAVVFLSCRGTLRGIDTVEVRAHRPGSYWSVDQIAKTGPLAQKCMIVGPSSSLTCLPKKLPAVLAELKRCRWNVEKLVSI